MRMPAPPIEDFVTVNPPTALSELPSGLLLNPRGPWEGRVEAYLELHASLRGDSAAVLDLIWNECVARRDHGDAPQLDEYKERFPELATQLQSMLQLLDGEEEAPRTYATPLKDADRVAGDAPEQPTVPGYEIIAELGRGGMGVVYLARQHSLKRLVALKMILAGAHGDAMTKIRFLTEAEAIARLTHPNVVQIHEIGEHQGRPFLALEYVAGGGLEKRVGVADMTEREAARLVEKIARAVHYTHQNGILHRDLKPSNILLSADGSPKITDFGLAKLIDADNGLTKTEALIGTPNYMSPEQAAGNTKKIGVPSDVFSLGAILYELLTRQKPFRGTSLLNTLEQVRNQEPMAPRRLCGNIPRDLETICLKCLEKEPSSRYPSADALADELQRFLAGEPILARPIPTWQRAFRAVRRRPGLMACIASIAALLCIAGVSGWYASIAGQLARHRTEENYQKFVQCRNDALFYGLLAADDRAVFVTDEAAANLHAAESAAREALALAGVDPQSSTPAVDSAFPANQQRAMTEDCYTLLLVLANIEGRSSKNQEALRLLDAAGKLGIETRVYYLRRAQLLTKVGQPEEAHRATDQADTVPPETTLDQFLFGEEHYRRGEVAKATSCFDRVLVQQPGHFWAQFFHAVCQLKTQKWGTAKTGLNGCLSQQPDFVWGYLFRSFAHEKLQEWSNAEADFAKAQQLNPNEHARYVLFLTRGIFYFNQRDLDRAGADFRAAIALKPDQYNGYLNLAQVYVAQQKFDQAEEQVATAMRLHPPVPAVFGYHLERGRNLLQELRYEDALKACRAARELSDKQPEPFEISGRAYLGMGRFEDAERSFDQYLAKGGEPLPDVYRGRGQARMKLGKYVEAAQDYARVVEKTPDAEIYQHLGWAHFFADAWKLAQHDFSKAIGRNPDLSDAYTGRGLAHVMLGQHAEAVADAEKALARKPASAEMMHNIACIYAQASVLADADLASNDRQALAMNYRRRAVDALSRTLAMVPAEERGTFWRGKIVHDAALAPLRNEIDFQRLEKLAAQP
jgi:eukaryotic-like serine/threonine-protein kinase